jgi:hypothetical protein
VNGTTQSTAFIGNGAGLTDLGADKITTGTLNNARLTLTGTKIFEACEPTTFIVNASDKLDIIPVYSFNITAYDRLANTTASYLEAGKFTCTYEDRNGTYKLIPSNIPNVKYWTEEAPLKYSVKTIQKTYLLSRNVKLSDNWWLFSCRYPQPKTKHFKEISDKYLDVIMKLNNLSGDKIKRVLHKLKHNFNPELFQWAVSIFGNDYISQKPDDILVDIFHSKECPNGLINFEDIKSKKERDNIFNIFMLVVEGEINPQTFYDHFRFYKRIKKFEDIKWKSQNYDDFREEHLDWTEKHDFYTKGTYKRIYSESFVSFIETPINETVSPI